VGPFWFLGRGEGVTPEQIVAALAVLVRVFVTKPTGVAPSPPLEPWLTVATEPPTGPLSPPPGSPGAPRDSVEHRGRAYTLMRSKSLSASGRFSSLSDLYTSCALFQSPAR